MISRQEEVLFLKNNYLSEELCALCETNKNCVEKFKLTSTAVFFKVFLDGNREMNKSLKILLLL